MLSPKHFRQEAFRHVLEIRNLQKEIEDLRSRIPGLGEDNIRLRKMRLTQEILIRRAKIEKHLTEAYSRLGVDKSRTEVVLMVSSDGVVSLDGLRELDSLESAGMIWSTLSPCPECGDTYLSSGESSKPCVCITGQDCDSCDSAEHWECSSCGALFEYSLETHEFELVPEDWEEDNP